MEEGSSLYDFFWLNGQELILKPEWHWTERRTDGNVTKRKMLIDK